ncbi:protein BTG2-like [Phascolarctos cinereus]|uniref:Protein BTG2-like n=1 Tax=Phascolarctos cinereus TaxID=38626 RepID=A0A6P5ID34_PHACI|nr:protein BTG2-like [Phascolarctos cinereus]
MRRGPGAAMRAEVASAAGFITRLLRGPGGFAEDQLQLFRESLQEALTDHYQHHWFPRTPSRGSGYRCIRINHRLDPLVGRAAGESGLSPRRLFQLLPRELTLWVDPSEVSYRIGEDGSIGVLYRGPPARSPPIGAPDGRGSRYPGEWRRGPARTAA